MTDSRLTRIRTALHDDSGLELGEPATEAEVGAFETKHRITLPTAFRQFVLEVANGLSVDGEPTLYSLVAIGSALESDPAQPFWYSNADATALRAAVATDGGVLTSERVMALQKQGTSPGCLPVAEGDGNDSPILVVTGEQAGVMWRTGEVDLPDSRARYVTGANAMEPLDFVSWFELWAVDYLGIEL